jgi:hypothetical protein
MKRSCKRKTAVLATPVCRMISLAPQAAEVSRTILAHQTCFCELVRSAITASRRTRSVALSMSIPLLTPGVARSAPDANPFWNSSVRVHPLALRDQISGANMPLEMPEPVKYRCNQDEHAALCAVLDGQSMRHHVWLHRAPTEYADGDLPCRISLIPGMA